ncbi:uncharacterized protein LOC129088779 [Anoplopoma fimbria]|uniref:uncharacterized protein LOC129088779 n=1 Tax=Anoplopoma fimbria TaxID=229290 RepID=UPI0023EB13C8|nr:uncharacterized protein LOC129088779 [Anoplopoma fimbria]
MASRGPPMEEDLLEEDWINFHNFYAGGFFLALNHGYEGHYPVIPEENRVADNPPLPPGDQVEVEEEIDVVGLDDGAVFQVAEPHRGEGDGGGGFRALFDQLAAWRGEENDDEEIHVVGLGSDGDAGGFFRALNHGIERLHLPLPPDDEEEEIDFVGLDNVAEPHRGDGDAGAFFRALNHRMERPHHPLPPDDQEEEIDVVGVDDEGGDGPPSPPVLRFPSPNLGMDQRQQDPVYVPVSPAAPYSPHYACLLAYLYAAPYPAPYAFLPAAPFIDPYSFPPAAPYAFLPAAPFIDPYSFNPAAPPTNPPAFLNADPHGVPEQVSGDAETMGPLSSEQSSGFYGSGSSLEEAPASPSTSSSSTRRRRDESDEEQAAAKRPRWSDESDSD